MKFKKIYLNESGPNIDNWLNENFQSIIKNKNTIFSLSYYKERRYIFFYKGEILCFSILKQKDNLKYLFYRVSGVMPNLFNDYFTKYHCLYSCDSIFGGPEMTIHNMYAERGLHGKNSFKELKSFFLSFLDKELIKSKENYIYNI